MILRAANKIKTSLIRSKFSRLAQSVRDTAPVDNFNSESNVVVLSMVQKKDVDMYLLALKSFLSYLSVKKVVLVADPTIDEEDRQVLSSHIKELEIRPVEEFRDNGIPKGGCWERLNAVIQYSERNYVIQLDADTLTLSRPDEVITAVEAGNPFTLGTNQGQVLSSLVQASDFAKSHIKSDTPHVQLAAEAALTEVDLPISQYVRGCAGFTGFAKGYFTQQSLLDLSQAFQSQLGDKWHEWGSEQFASNLLLANQPGLVILPIKKYLTPVSADFTDQCFLHLIGSMRFANNIYLSATRQVLADLDQSGSLTTKQQNKEPGKADAL